MTTALDYTVGIGKESVYGTAVAPTRFFESEAKMSFPISTVQGSGLRPSKRVNRLKRNTLSKVEVLGETSLDITDAGFGFLLEAFFGAYNVPASGNGFFEFVPTKTDPMPSYTIEEVIPVLGGGAGVGTALRFTGCVASELTLEFKEGAVATAKVTWVGRNFIKNATAAAASYPVDDELVTWVGGVATYGVGALSGGIATPARYAIAAPTDLKATEFSLSFKNNLDTGGFTLGGAGQRTRRPALGKMSVEGKFSTELEGVDYLDWYTTQAARGIVLNFLTSRNNLSHGMKCGLSIALPALKLKGEIPTSNGGSVPVQSIDFEAFDNDVNGEAIRLTFISPTEATP